MTAGTKKSRKYNMDSRMLFMAIAAAAAAGPSAPTAEEFG